MSEPHCTGGVEEVESVEKVDYMKAKLVDEKGDSMRLRASGMAETNEVGRTRKGCAVRPSSNLGG